MNRVTESGGNPSQEQHGPDGVSEAQLPDPWGQETRHPYTPAATTGPGI